MKELHNNIFSNTTCISKETMLKYINKQLDNAALHEVEKHLLDCELCTDAMEGLKYAQNSSVLFTINYKIDQRVKKRSTKFSIINSLMIAASVLVIAFGSYFTFNFFHASLKNENNLAVNNTQKTMPSSPKENFIFPAKEKNIIVKEFTKKEAVAKPPLTIIAKNNKQKAGKKDKLTASIKSIETSAVATPDDMDSEVAATPAMANEEITKKGERLMVDEENQNNVAGGNTLNEGVPKSLANRAKNKILTKQNQKVEEDKDKNKLNKPKLAASNTNKYRQLNYIETYKVIDYTLEYQNNEAFKKQAEPTSISPNFATKAAKNLADSEFDKSTIKITYKQTLTMGIHQFKLTNYKAALVQFSLILVKHPKDVNALFYAGLSNYNLKNYPQALALLNKVLNNQEIVFNQEATWYKSLTFIGLKENKKAKKLLKQIINKAGFYKTKAEKQLKML